MIDILLLRTFFDRPIGGASRRAKMKLRLVNLCMKDCAVYSLLLFAVIAVASVEECSAEESPKTTEATDEAEGDLEERYALQGELV